jgi:NADH-quinone oxidoreductase subunit L
MESNLAWFILLNPLIAAILVHACLRRSPGTSAAASVLSSVLGLVAGIGVWFSYSRAIGHDPDYKLAAEIPWLDFGTALRIPIGLVIDRLSAVMVLVVTGVGALIHIYSIVYMGSDTGKARYFGNLSLFMFSMLGIVLANNFVMMFIFWELVGLSSYLLIGHWFTRNTAADAANKAFITNRIGDFGFMLGILMVWAWAGSLVFADIERAIPELNKNASFLTGAVLLVFCGAVGKSAQLPLHVWLPDAMEGPTPVSALIHAATMVAAGVYMLARVFFLVALSPTAQGVIAWIGILTALLAALMATQQDDIKRILAYSTLSQLGYMISAIGLAAPGAAMFHLFTHAFFKALLFLGAGAIIHHLHHEQDIWKMGGLKRPMKWTFLTFTAGYLALIGCPFFSGFFSKDAILLAAADRSFLIFLFGLLTAFLTAFYMTRLFVVVFLGKARTHEAEHGHDGPIFMTGPLILLGLLSIIAGYFSEEFFDRAAEISPAISIVKPVPHVWWVPTLAILAFVGGVGMGWILYFNKEKDPILIPAFKNKFYFDELYAALIAGTQDLLANLSGYIDKWVIDGVLVRGLSGAAWACGFVLRFFQFGNLQGYSFLFGGGVVALILYMLLT